MMNWPENYNSLLAWWQTPPGRAYLVAEKTLIQARLANVFGYQLVVIGDSEFSDYANTSRLVHYTRINPLEPSAGNWPDNIDVLILPHWLSYFPEAKAVLTECQNRLVNGGLLLLTSYDSFTICGWQPTRPTSASVAKPCWSSKQLKKMLLAEQFEAPLLQRYRLNSQGQADKNWFGGLTLLETNKTIATVKQLKKSWTTQSKTMAQPVVAPLVIPEQYEHH